MLSAGSEVHWGSPKVSPLDKGGLTALRNMTKKRTIIPCSLSRSQAQLPRQEKCPNDEESCQQVRSTEKGMKASAETSHLQEEDSKVDRQRRENFRQRGLHEP